MREIKRRPRSKRREPQSKKIKPRRKLSCRRKAASWRRKSSELFCVLGLRQSPPWWPMRRHSVETGLRYEGVSSAVVATFMLLACFAPSRQAATAATLISPIAQQKPSPKHLGTYIRWASNWSKNPAKLPAKTMRTVQAFSLRPVWVAKLTGLDLGARLLALRAAEFRRDCGCDLLGLEKESAGSYSAIVQLPSRKQWKRRAKPAKTPTGDWQRSRRGSPSLMSEINGMRAQAEEEAGGRRKKD